MTWHTAHDRFLSFSAWLSAILYAVPAVILVLVFDHFDSTKDYVVPALLVYLVAAIAHMLGYGFQAVCVQIKVATDYALEQRAGEKKE